MSDAVTERLQAAVDRGRALQQIAEAEPIAAVGGLSQIEIMLIAVAAGIADTPDAAFSLWKLRDDAENAGISKVGISLALRRLMQKQFLEAAFIDDFNGNQHSGVMIRSHGWDWIDANEALFNLRHVQREDRSTPTITDHDLPF